MGNEEKKNITIADVAEALGVSKTTVSRAISGKGRIGQETVSYTHLPARRRSARSPDE